MASQRRLERLQVVLREELAKIVAREVEFPPGVLVTLTRTIIAEDLFNAAVFVSVIPVSRVDEALKGLGEQIFEIQQLLNKKMRMRPVPKIRFVADTAEAEAADVEKELYKLKKEAD